MIGLDKNSVKVVPYDATWKDEFEKEKVILKNLLKDFETVSPCPVTGCTVVVTSARYLASSELPASDRLGTVA